MKGSTSKSVKSGSGESTTSPPSIGETIMTEEDGKSMLSESGVHTSQMALPSPSAAGDGAQEGGQTTAQKRKSKRQLWDDLTISCER